MVVDCWRHGAKTRHRAIHFKSVHPTGQPHFGLSVPIPCRKFLLTYVQHFSFGYHKHSFTCSRANACQAGE